MLSDSSDSGKLKVGTTEVPAGRSRIFISYRHEVDEYAVGRLAEELRRHFPRDQVFEDIASIDPGADFVDALQHGLNTCAAVLVVIGPNWVTATDRQGRRRLALPDDWVRYEVAESLRDPGVRVFPLLLDAEMPSADDLPESLRPLTRRQAFPLTGRHWANDTAKLIEFLKKVPGLQRASQPDVGSSIGDGLATRPSAGNEVASGKAMVMPLPAADVGAQAVLAPSSQFVVPPPKASPLQPTVPPAERPTSARMSEPGPDKTQPPFVSGTPTLPIEDSRTDALPPGISSR